MHYPQETVKDLWKMMFENSAHDSSANCVSDSVNEDIYFRYKQIRDIAFSLVEITLREISVRIKNPTDYPVTLTVFNTLLTPRSEVVKTVLYTPYLNFEIKDSNNKTSNYSIERIIDESEEVKSATIQLNPGETIYKPNKVYKATISLEARDIPPMGYKQFYIVQSSANRKTMLTASQSSKIENEKYIVEVNSKGSLDITDRENGKIYKNQAVLEENGDDGDSYNYSPAHYDLTCYSTEQKYTVETKKTKVTQILKIKYEFKVPKNLKERKLKKCTTLFPVTLEVRLNNNSQIVDFNVYVDNRKIDDHRLCIDFNTEIKAKYSIDDIQFGTIKRPFILKKAMDS